MGRAKIGIISPYSEFTETVNQLARDLNLDVYVQEEILDKAIDIVRDWEIEGQIEIVIARGGTAAILKKQVKIPVVMMQVTSYDIADAIYRAKLTGNKIALMDLEHQPPRFDYNRISQIVGTDFNVFQYNSLDQLQQTVSDIARQKIDVVVCTGVYAFKKAKEYGLQAVLVHSSREFIQDAIKKAWDICRVRRRDLRLCRSFQGILDNAYDGIMAVEKSEVTIFNPIAEKLAGIKAANVIGKSITEICRINAVCRALYGDARAVSGQLIYLGDLPLVVNRVHMALGQNKHGILVTFQAADKIRRMEAKIRQELNNKGLVAKFRFSDIVGKSAMITETIQEARQYARSEASIMITGESGTGKELIAQSMHNESNRREGPFVAINCAALPENLLESELFGYEHGAFTGARKGGKQGLFSLAHGGTIFLDEIGELSPNLQARLLRVLQEKEVMPVGGQRVIPVDVKVISATNQNITKAINEGRFRSDLYYRLNVLNLQVPPLRDRLEDVPVLFRYFLERLAGQDILVYLNIDTNLLEALKSYMWPGNVRELEGFAERYVALGEENSQTHITFYTLLNKLTGGDSLSSAINNSTRLNIELGNMLDMEKQIIIQASKLIRGSRVEMARVLGISRTTLWKKLKELGVNLPDEEQMG